MSALASKGPRLSRDGATDPSKSHETDSNLEYHSGIDNHFQDVKRRTGTPICYTQGDSCHRERCHHKV